MPRASEPEAAFEVPSHRAPRRLGARADAVVASLLGWMLAAIVTAARVQLTDPVWSGVAAGVHVAVAVGHLLGFGAVASALVWLSRRAPRGRWIRRAGVVLATAPPAHVLLREDFGGVARRASAFVPGWLTTGAGAVAAAISLLVAIELGARLRGRARRALTIAGAALVIWIEPSVLRGLYPGIHAFAVMWTATLAGSALVGAALPRLVGRHPRRLALPVALVGLATYAIPLSPQVQFLVVRDGDVVAQVAGDLLLRPEEDVPRELEDSAEASRWLEPADQRPDAPPTPGERFARDPIVVLVTIDCLRYDLVTGDRAARLPNIARFLEESVSFERAQAPGSSTVYTLSSMFSGKYYSQLEWSGRGVFPITDTTPRFPDILRESGVWTVHAASFDWLVDELGVARGFDVVDYDTLAGPRWKPAESLAAAIVDRLGQVGQRSALLYVHFNDAHGPYDRAGRHGTPFERYLRELQLVDRQLGTILRAIDRRGLRSRTLVIVTADHGEAFGEHGLETHANSLYQELTHVPLLIRAPGVARRRVWTRVSLIDLGPTILDVFGLPTPAHFMGESLYPALLGERLAPTRPIIAQSGHLRSLVTPEGLKVIRDSRRGTLEAYDLKTDPRELENLMTESRADVSRAFAFLRHFFEVHQFRWPGYEEPFRR